MNSRTLLFSFVAFLLATPVAMGINMTIEPQSFNITLNSSSNITQTVNITNNENSSIHVNLSSIYVSAFTMNDFWLGKDSKATISFTVVAPNITEISNGTQFYNSTLHLTLNHTESKDLPLYLYVLMPQYQTMNATNTFYLNCTLIGGVPSCIPFNESAFNETFNRTIINLTENRYITLTEDFLKVLIDMFNNSAQLSRESINRTLEIQDVIKEYLQNTEDTNKNALIIMGVLDNPKNDVWTEYAPSNTISQISNISIDQVSLALQVLLGTGKIAQKTEIRQVSIHSPDGTIITRNEQVILLASNTRLENQSNERRINILIIMFVAFIAVCASLFFLLRYWRRPGKFKRA